MTSEWIFRKSLEAFKVLYEEIFEEVREAYLGEHQFWKNIYRDEFFAEARIWNIPDVNYDFDSADLAELKEKLQAKMLPRLKQVRNLAEQEAVKRQQQVQAKEDLKHDSD